MTNYYDPEAMKTLAGKLSEHTRAFKEAKDQTERLVAQMNSYWKDSLNLKYYSSYQQSVRPKADQLYEQMRRYTELMYQCSRRYGSAIDNGNTYLNSF